MDKKREKSMRISKIKSMSSTDNQEKELIKDS